MFAPDPAAFGENDFRRTNPRFVAPNWSANNARVEALRSYARDHGWSTAALAIAWTLAQGDHVIPIPGTRSPAHLDQLAQGLEIRLGAKELAEIENILPVGFAHGERYTPAQLIGTELYC